MVRIHSISIALAALASCVFASISNEHTARACGTEVSQLAVVQPHVRLGARQASTNSTNSSIIDLYFHVILAENNTESSNESADFITDELVEKQMSILNDGFKPMGYKFNLIQTTRTVNSSWFYNATQNSPRETDMKAALRQGDKKSLNVYIVGCGYTSLTDTSIVGWSTVPLEVQFSIPNDGVVLHRSVLPGGANTNGWNLGKTLIHESGHWVGLYHTFSGGCEYNDDYVDDTPLEAVPAGLGGCPEGRDSCSNATGLDPIHNYMDYTSDECRTEFTPGQVAYAHTQMEQWRDIYTG